MAAFSSIAAVMAAVAISAIATSQLSKQKSPKMPTATPPPVPSGPATIADKMNFGTERSVDPLPTPEGISFGSNLSPEQQRSQIATGGTAGNTGMYRTPEVQKFYKDLAFRTLTDAGGNPTGEPLGVERQYARDVLGVEPREPTTASFLSALLRN